MAFRKQEQTDRGAYLPEAEAIRLACIEIRKTWIGGLGGHAGKRQKVSKRKPERKTPRLARLEQNIVREVDVDYLPMRDEDY